jgi:ankyrin repeat protein
MTTVTGVAGINITFGEEDDDNFVDLDDALKKLGAEVMETQPTALLLQGAKEGDLDKVKRALAKGADIAATATNGDTVLHLAVRSGEAQVVRHLILQKADVNSEDGRGYAPLNLAAERAEEVIAGMLLAAGAHPEHQIPKLKETPLITAAHKGCEKLVERLITRRVDLNATDCNGVTAAMRAAGDSHAGCLDMLTRAGADLELKSKTGRTAHDFAHRARAQKCLRVLNGVGDMQATLMNACQDGTLSALKAALDAGTDINKPDQQGRIALHLAVTGGKMDIIEMLLEQKPELNVHDGNGNTPLGNALAAKNYRAAKLLVEAGADPDQPSGPNRETPLMKACNWGDIRPVDLLLDAKATLDFQDAQGRTALMHIDPTKTNIMKKLLDLGAHPGFRDSKGMTLLMRHKDSLSMESVPAVQFLEKYLPELDARVQNYGSLRPITTLKAIKMKSSADVNTAAKPSGGNAP